MNESGKSFNVSNFNLSHYQTMLSTISGPTYGVLLGIYNAAISAYITANSREGRDFTGIVEQACEFGILAVKRTLFTWEERLFTDNNVTGLNRAAS